MAKETKNTKETAAKVPTFTLRADNPKHIHALIAAAEKLPDAEQGEALRTIREFDLYMEQNA